jgi:HSP20 family protein
MSQLTRFNQNLMDDFFSGLTSPAYFIKPLHGEGLEEGIKVDIKENKRAFDIHAQIPGAQKDDVRVSVDGSMVTIQAEVKQLDQKTEDEKIVRSECYYGSASRSFQLPIEIDATATKAHYENGILHLHLPKKTNGSSKQITVT